MLVDENQQRGVLLRGHAARKHRLTRLGKVDEMWNIIYELLTLQFMLAIQPMRADDAPLEMQHGKWSLSAPPVLPGEALRRLQKHLRIFVVHQKWIYDTF